MFKSQARVVGDISHFMTVFQDSEARIRPHFFLTGTSGSGKSFLTRQVAEKLHMPYFEVNAASLTSEGISGNSLSKALRPLRNHWDKPNIIFVDEFDKLFQRNGETTESFRSSIQDEFLHCLESRDVSVFGEYGKYDPVKIDNTLFIFAGAFNNQEIRTIKQLKETGLRTEFVGRVPLVVSTDPVPMDELYEALPKIALFQEYRKLFPQRKQATDVKAIMELMEAQNKETNIGIRLLNSAIHQHFMKS